jgi:hypothetical protein
MAVKLERYLAAGVQLVWVTWARWKQVDVWHPGETTPTTLTVADSLEGENVVPGFTY